MTISLTLSLQRNKYISECMLYSPYIAMEVYLSINPFSSPAAVAKLDSSQRIYPERKASNSLVSRQLRGSLKQRKSKKN